MTVESGISSVNILLYHAREVPTQIGGTAKIRQLKTISR